MIIMTRMYKCVHCNNYTLDDARCPKCGEAVKDPKPPKYSPADKYGEYRRRAKRKVRSAALL